MRTAVLGVVAAAALAAGCGEDEPAVESATTPTATAEATATPEATTASRMWDQDDLVRELGLREVEGGRAYEHARTGCGVETVLVSASAVEDYAGPRDRLATMPDDTAGVVVEPSAAQRCVDVMSRALAVVASGEKIE